MPEGWDVSVGGFPAMTGKVPFLMNDVVFLYRVICRSRTSLASHNGNRRDDRTMEAAGWPKVAGPLPRWLWLTHQHTRK
jgi:hypothetical protein